MGKIVYADYSNCLVNLSNSILSYYGAKPYHSTLKEVDRYLKKEYKNVVVLLYDGFGSRLLERNLNQESFLRNHKVTDITSVFPATTTAATISLITGRTPAEHCWLGWDVYIETIDKIVTIFLNTEKSTKVKLADYSIAEKEFPFFTIFDKIKETQKAQAHYLSPFGDVYYDPKNPDQMYDKIVELCNRHGKKFIYAYCNEPDHTMHHYGTEHGKTIDIMKMLDQKAKQLCDQLEDTLVIITADHGHVTVGNKYTILADYPSLKRMLVRETSIEARAVNFFVKEGMLEDFKEEFHKLFGNDFILYSKQEIMERKIFGNGKPHEKFVSCLGDYMALAISDRAIKDEYEPDLLKGLHAGITEDEVLIPLIIIDKKKNDKSLYHGKSDLPK